MRLRTILVWAFAMAVPLANVGAQDARFLAGTWQGTLVPKENRGARRPMTPPRDSLRFDVVITTANDGTPTWTWRSQQLNGTAPFELTAEGDTIRISVPAWDGSWEGKLSADRSTLNGTWRQGGLAQSLVLKRTSAN